MVLGDTDDMPPPRRRHQASGEDELLPKRPSGHQIGWVAVAVWVALGEHGFAFMPEASDSGEA